MDQTFGPYSPVRKAGPGWFFISGQIGVNPQTKTADASISGQTHQVLKNLGYQLETEGLDYGDVVKTTVFLKHIDDFAAVNEIYLQYFHPPRPARSCVEVAALPKVTDTDLLVEIEAVAYAKEGTAE